VGGRDGFVGQLARSPDAWEPGPFTEAIEHVDARIDCADFAVAGLLRSLFLHRAAMPAELVAEVERCLLGFRYWWDEPGPDRMCFHTENHQILFHSNELLAGQLFGDRVFGNTGTPGAARVAHATPLVERWLALRAAAGWSEWLANGYTEHNLLALLNLHDFAASAELRAAAGRLVDVLLFELSLHSYRGVFGSTHGRSYAGTILRSRSEGTASLCRLALGTGSFEDPASLGAVALATSGYRPPPVLETIAADPRPATFRERQGFDVAEAGRFGLGLTDERDGHAYWAMQEFMHPDVLPLTRRLQRRYGLGLDRDPAAYVAEYARQRAEHGRIVDPLRDCHALTEARVQTYRTGDGMLSSVRDYRPGSPGYQQHVWQATLGPDAVVFTNHPGGDEGDLTGRPNFWAGNGVLPRAGQAGNVLVCVHRVPPSDPRPYSHAYLPADRFDRVVAQDGWVFAALGTGYLALHSQHRWQARGDELRVSAVDNTWLCEVGRAADWGGFEDFVAAVAGSEVRHEGGRVAYRSPSRGLVGFGWHGPLTVDGTQITHDSGLRFDNPWLRSPIGADQELERVIRA
jgi:hypothetical protein